MGEEEKLDDSIHDARLFDNPDSRPIYLLATDCRNLFSKIGKQLEKGHHLEEFNLVSDSHDRFEAWAAFLAVFGSSVSSLDYRLRKHPSVQDSVMRLLDILRDKLLIDYDAVPDSIKTWAPNQISGSPNINELLIRLNRLGLWIRSLSRPGSKKKRVRAIAESQNLDLQGFQYLSCLSIETIYPNCPETLREQLASSMTDRFAQLWYESFRVGTLSKSTSATSTNDNPESSFYTKEDKSLAAKETPPENEKNTRPHVAFIIPATTIPVDQQQEHWGSESKLLQQSYPTQTETALDPYPAEPPIPTFEEGKDYAKCEWCFAMLEDTMFRKKNGRHTWSQKGRKHYRYDLRPYICISEGCFESFTSKGSWAEHMTSEHSEDWPQRIHNEPVWVCDLKHDQATLYMFATRVELENHVHLHHQMDESAAFHTSLSRPSASCPLCLFAVADQSDDSGPARDDTTFHEVSELRRHPLSNTVNHIARHMEFITVLTLRLVSNTLQSDGRESDSRSVFSTTSNLNSSDVARHGHGLAEDFGIEENDPTLTYLETPVPSLPGSSDWNGIGTAHLNGVAIGDTKVIDRMRQWNERNTLHDGPIILPWVKTIDYHSYQRKLSSERQPGTGQWFIDSEEFHRWSDSEDQTLFCSGERGAGKTILTSLVIDELQSCFNTNETISITYLFLNPEMQQEKSPEILCISLLQQLLNQRKSSPSNIKSIYDRYEIDKVRPPLEDILKGLELAALLFSRVYIVVDALDEVPTEYREKFLSSVFHLQKECSPLLQKVKFFATYRFDMSPTRLFQQALTLRIEAKPEDVSKYVYGNLHHFSTFIKHDGQLPEAMTSAIMQFTKGIFSRASFFLNSLTHKKSASEIRDALVLLRTDLDYEYAMHLILGESMELREHALRVLSWLTCAHRQLTAIEVQHIITTRIGKSELDKSRILGTGPIISACHGLVIVDEDDMIRFADDAAKTYFQKKRKEWFPEAEYDISGICATYLSLNVFNDGICQTDDEFEERLRSHALYEYAAQNWGHHCREATTINNAVTQFLTKKAHVEAASQLLMATDTKGSPGYSQRVPRNITGLHLAAYFGIEEVVLQLLSQISPSIEDSYNRTPLWYARKMNQHGIIKLLIDRSKGTDKPLSMSYNLETTKILALFTSANLGVDQIKKALDLGFTDAWIPMNTGSFPPRLSPSTCRDLTTNQLPHLTKEFYVHPEELLQSHFNLHEDAICPNSGLPKSLKYEKTIGSSTSTFTDVSQVRCPSGTYALKRIRRNIGNNEERLEWMNYITGELHVLRKIHEVNFRHFVKLIASYTDQNYVGLLLSPAADCNLATYLKDYNKSPDPNLLKSFFGCLTTALAHLHFTHRIRHKDIKPENILVFRNRVLLVDFGISLDWSVRDGTTTQQERKKRITYCSPELDQGKPRSSKSDIWSLGCVFLEMFAVLKGKASSYVGAILKRERHAIPRFCRSKKAIDDIIKDLEAHNPQCENEPLRWIGMMLEWEVEDRPQATELRDYILKDGYCGICCYHNYMFEGIPTH